MFKSSRFFHTLIRYRAVRFRKRCRDEGREMQFPLHLEGSTQVSRQCLTHVSDILTQPITTRKNSWNNAGWLWWVTQLCHGASIRNSIMPSPYVRKSIPERNIRVMVWWACERRRGYWRKRWLNPKPRGVRGCPLPRIHVRLVLYIVVRTDQQPEKVRKVRP